MNLSEVTIVIPAAGEMDRDYARNLRDVIHSLVNVRVILVEDEPYGAAILEGVSRAQTDAILTMDGDGQHSLWDALRLYTQYLERQVDMLIGYRPLKDRASRLPSSLLMNLVASIAAGPHVKDCGSGLRVFRRSLALDMALPSGFDFNTAFTARLLMRGYKVEWAPISVAPRRHGRSHVRWHDALKTLRTLTTTR